MTPTEVLIKDLRSWSVGDQASDDARRMVWLMSQAADEIERLRADSKRTKREAVERAVVLLREYADEAETVGRNPVAAHAMRMVADRLPMAKITNL